MRRATMINGAVQRGDNVLITGIGGGVALLALQLCVAKGANVYVTSGGEDKIRRAVELGAKGGVSYKASASIGQQLFDACFSRGLTAG